MQLPFGLEIHWPANATEWSAWATIIVASLTGVYVWLTRQNVMELHSSTEKTVSELRASTEKQLAELRESRYAEFAPSIRWQSPAARVEHVAGTQDPWEMQLDVYLSNEGPGAARIYDYQLEARIVNDPTNIAPEAFEVKEIDRPSTIPKAGSPGDRGKFKIRSGERDVFQPGTRVFKVTLVYGDLLGEFEYETVIRIKAYFDAHTPCTAEFAEPEGSDERSVLERRRAFRNRRVN